ncbi:hypothetical protein Cgig2_001589 [Carnegiea gigantea]|uniref:Uncharacterized protein n=1 Tax=Carnegiea gigantea TaxID=171969 RepID=A0A9Q1KB52_9CARY|nr:hypothetical protein Cgig2_001589 [Carnegiea gigantea]
MFYNQLLLPFYPLLVCPLLSCPLLFCSKWLLFCLLIGILISATIHMMASPKDRGLRKNKRKWKEEEDDDTLIEVFKDLVNGGTSFKANSGFQPGFLNTVVEKLQAKLPESNLKAQPHLEAAQLYLDGTQKQSQRWPRKKFGKLIGCVLILSILHNAKSPRANDWRGKPCPYYKDLCIIFGKDRASGKDAQSPEGMEDEGENKESSKKDEPEYSSTQEPFGVEMSFAKSKNL